MSTEHEKELRWKRAAKKSIILLFLLMGYQVLS